MMQSLVSDAQVIQQQYNRNNYHIPLITK